jgi:crotonobetainyl-CoA:carnitine CoA-transferase CaiB-like acyl-CoA transferase
MLGAQNQREWRRFCEQVLLDPALVDDPRFADNEARDRQRALLQQLIERAFARLSVAEVVQRLDAAQIANAQVNDMGGLWRHPQLAARRRWTEVGSPAGPLPALLPPGQTAADDPANDGPNMGAVPALGEHTELLLGELGLDGAAIAALRASHAV